MSHSPGIRFGGFISIVASLLLIVGTGLLVAGQRVIGQSFYSSAFIFLTFAAATLYGLHARRTGAAGLTGVAMAALGSALSTIPAAILLAHAHGVKEAAAVMGFYFKRVPVTFYGVC